MTPDVSVIIPTYNSAAFIDATLGSVFVQSIGMDRIEIIVIDDGSTDGTADRLDQLALDHPNMTVLRQANSGGPARPRNKGLDRAVGRYIFFLDADDIMNTECLERMIRCADEQGSDVVLGRLKGGGGRRPPTAMFTSTQLATNAFDSRVWWALNALKLFRRDFIERLGLRFREDIFSEDQPFSGTAYLNASAISVLSDYDYVTFVWREDQGNMTLADIPLSKFTDALAVMIDLIVDNVEAGPNRDHLLTRHFDIEFFKIFAAMVRSEDPGSVRETFELLREWAVVHYPFHVVEHLSPAHRVAHHLLLHGEFDRLLAFMSAYVADPVRTVTVEGERVFAHMPNALGEAEGIPEECFDVTALVKVRYQLDRVEWVGGVLRLEGAAALDLFDTEETTAWFVLRERTTGHEHTLPAAWSASPGFSTRLWRLLTPRPNAGVHASVDPLVAADGARLADGVWDVLLRLSARGITREARIGRVRAPEIDTSFAWRVVRDHDKPRMIVGSYFTASYDNLSLDVGGPQRCGVPWVAATASWRPGRSGKLEISGASNVVGLDVAEAVRVGIRCGSEGHTIVPTTGAGDVIATTVDASAIHRSGLKAGDWSVTLEVNAGESSAEFPVRPTRQLDPAWVWLAGWPHRVSVSGPGSPLVLHVRRLGPALVARGLRRRKRV